MPPIEFRFRSRALAWCRYFPDALDLDICFVNGATYRYLQVPRSIVDGLVTAASVGRYFNCNIANQYIATHPRIRFRAPNRSQGTAEDLLKRSLTAITPHLPVEWVEPIYGLLNGTPVLVRVVRRRKTKRGDHRVAMSQGFSVISVNASGNQWEFVLTLLHELAHAHVAHEFRHRVPPHGVEWKQAFRRLLVEHLHLFAPDLIDAVSDYARNPLYASDAHSDLAFALRRHDTLDLRPTVQELEHGQMFSLNGKTVLIKNRLLRKRFLCVSTDGRLFHVPPTARVHIIYDPPSDKN